MKIQVIKLQQVNQKQKENLFYILKLSVWAYFFAYKKTEN